MDTESLIWLALFCGVSGVAGIACLVIDVIAKRRQADWTGEGNTRGIR